MIRQIFLIWSKNVSCPMTSYIYEGDLEFFSGAYQARNIQYMGQRITDILQLKYCKKMEVESQNLCMKDMRL